MGSIDKTQIKDSALISIIVKADFSKYAWLKALKTSIKGVHEHLNSGDVQLVIAADSEDALKNEKLNNLIGDYDIEVCSTDNLDSITAGEYVMVIDQGEGIKESYSNKLLSDIKRIGKDVFAVGKDVRDDNKDEDTIWRSIFAEPYYPIINVRGTIIRRKLIRSLRALTEKDHRSTGELISAILEARGYIDIRYPAITMLSDNTYEFNNEINDEVMDTLISKSEKKYGCVEEYLQATFLRMFRELILSNGSGEGVKKYIKYIDNPLIMGDKGFTFRRRFALMKMKQGEDLISKTTLSDNGVFSLENEELLRISAFRLKIDIIEIDNGKIIFEGRTDIPLLGSAFSIQIISSEGEKRKVEVKRFPPFDEYGFDGNMYYEGEVFRAEAAISDNVRYSFFIEDAKGRLFDVSPRFGDFAGLIDKAGESYSIRSGYMISYKNNSFSVRKRRAAAHIKKELEYAGYLIRRKKAAVVAYRLMSYADKIFSKKPVWIVADRPHLANDNGEHMFRYLQTTQAAKDNNIYFLIKKDAPDYERIRKTGKVLAYGSLKHKVKFLRSKVIICAAANNLVINAMGKNGTYYRDLYDYDFVYLRHGVSHNDQSQWINKYNKNIKVLVATCKPEYNGILKGDYGYTEEEVKLTGLPRYDNLKDERKKIIAILPTWRKDIQGELLEHSSERAYVKNFTNTEYFNFYNSLINDERLLKTMEENGYTGVFYLHPVFESQYEDFKSSRLITVGKGVADYQQVFKESALMVTDYSSVAFDFAFLKKPVIYSQFDEDTFYKNHAWGKGYFTYRRDGFGPITTSLDETVETLIEYIENDCKMKAEYIEKVDNFFAYSDRNNCKRVYEAIEKMERKRAQNEK